MIELHFHVSAFPHVDRMRFVAQEMVIRFLEPIINLAKSWQDRETATQILETAYRQARGGPVLRMRDAALHQHLDETVRKAAAEWDDRSRHGLVSEPFTKVLEGAFSKLRAALGRQRCDDCEADKLCGGILPAQRIEVEPRCLNSLYQLVKASATFTRDLYGRYLVGLTNAVQIDLHFTPEPDLANRITGVTEFTLPDARLALAGKAIPSWVSLGVPLGTLSAAEYFPIVYVMAHEVAVHTVQELLGERGRRHTKDRVAFAEGLVDQVIYDELRETVRHERTFGSLVPAYALPYIEAFHSSRGETGGAQKTPFWKPDIGFGRKAYEVLLKLGSFSLRVSANDMEPTAVEQEAREWAHGAALALNVMALSENERQGVVDALASLDDEFLDKRDGVAQLDAPDPGSTVARWAEVLAEIQEIPGPTGRKLLLELLYFTLA